MAIQNAMNLIRDVQVQPDLRKQINQLDRKELNCYLELNGYKFSHLEFEDSVNLLHLKCQTFEEADNLMNIAMWLKMVLL